MMNLSSASTAIFASAFVAAAAGEHQLALILGGLGLLAEILVIWAEGSD